ncbi:MAG: hypothetical protein Q9212_006188 [Teloschistes hypoglaucus]
MSTPKRQSPRAAIREWLAHTHQLATPLARHASKPKKQKGIESQEEDWHLSHHPRERSKSPPRHTVDTGNKLAKRNHPSPQRPKNPQQRPKDDRNLAEQLGLHAPFRSLATRGAEARVSPRKEGERRKRRRGLSEASSYLEPVVRFGDGDDGSENLRGAPTKQGSCGGRQYDTQMSSSSSSVVIVPPGEPNKNYERRPRHKTKEDCYELKQAKKRNQAKEKKNAVADRPKKKKRKHAQKSGAALMQDFNAENVQPERLTGEKEEKSGPVRKKARQKKDKAADTEAEFSRFFAAVKNQGDRVGETTMHGRRQHVDRPREQRSEEIERSSLPPVDLPEKPFLGFGSCGPRHDSPVLFSVSEAGSHVTGPYRPPSGRSMRYFTWSRSGTAENTRVGNHTHHPQHSVANDTEPPKIHEQGAGDRACGSDKRADPDFHHESYTSSNRSYDLRKPQPPGSAEDCTKVGPSTVLGHEKSNSISKDYQLEDQPRQQTKQEQDQPNHADPSTTSLGCTSLDLASMLATNKQPELLGAVLDALLSKITTQDLKARLGLKTSVPMDHEAVGDSGTAQQKYQTQNSNQINSPRASNLPPALRDCQEGITTKASSGPNGIPHEPQQPASTVQQADDHDLRRTPSLQGPNPMHEGYSIEHMPQISHSETVTRGVPQIVHQRPESSSAWTGYRHLYEGQFDENAFDYHYHEGLMEHDLNGAGLVQNQITGQSDDPLRSFVDDLESGDTLIQHQMDGDDHGPQEFTEDTWQHPSHQNSQPYGGVNEVFDQSQDRLPNADQDPHHAPLLDAGNSRSLWPRGSITEPGFDRASENIARPDTASFLGGKGFAAAMDRGQSHSSWKPEVRPMSRDDGRFLPALSSMQDGHVVGEMPLMRFWKPHRLY